MIRTHMARCWCGFFLTAPLTNEKRNACGVDTGTLERFGILFPKQPKGGDPKYTHLNLGAFLLGGGGNPFGLGIEGRPKEILSAD